MARSAKRFYAVLKGRNPGIYDFWAGPGGAEEQVRSFPGALFKGFATREEAREYAASSGDRKLPNRTSGEPSGAQATRVEKPEPSKPSERPGDGIVIFADGSSINNPGPGGYGVVICEGKSRRELSGGFRLTTNNRMELAAVIEGLRSFEKPPERPVTIYTDSRYVVDGISRGWARKWKRQGWMRNARNPAENIDLWSVLLDLVERYEPKFVWVKGHAGNIENERCDLLAKRAAQGSGLPPDLAYEKGETCLRPPTLF
jgi:ribonuclease HI